jgi:quinohemoprotein ethanol dehydrogenase
VQHDGWDLAAVAPVTIAEIPVNGKPRRVLMTAPKNGFFYVLDAMSGAFLSANNYTPVNWASHIDPKTGRPVTIPDARYWERPNEDTIVSPSVGGARTWHAMAFHPGTGLVYMPVSVTPTLMRADPTAVVGGVHVDMYYGSKGDPKWTAKGELVAWDPVAQKARWRVDRTHPYNSGVLATAGNLVFQGLADGRFEARAADTGELRWSFDTHGSMLAAPSSVEIDGKQLVLVATGNSGASASSTNLARYTSTPQSRSPSRLLAFALGGKGTVPETVVAAFAEPPLPRKDQELARKGEHLFEAQWCVGCHGHGAENVGSSIPDLRRSSAKTHEEFATIVVGGSRLDRGMPGFPEITADELQALHAFVLNAAWDAYESQEASRRRPAQ